MRGLELLHCFPQTIVEVLLEELVLLLFEALRRLQEGGHHVLLDEGRYLVSIFPMPVANSHEVLTLLTVYFLDEEGILVLLLHFIDIGPLPGFVDPRGLEKLSFLFLHFLAGSRIGVVLGKGLGRGFLFCIAVLDQLVGVDLLFESESWVRALYLTRLGDSSRALLGLEGGVLFGALVVEEELVSVDGVGLLGPLQILVLLLGPLDFAVDGVLVLGLSTERAILGLFVGTLIDVFLSRLEELVAETAFFDAIFAGVEFEVAGLGMPIFVKHFIKLKKYKGLEFYSNSQPRKDSF